MSDIITSNQINNIMALSPRVAPDRLRSNSPYGPRKSQSLFQGVALARGYTVKAGKATRSRLTRSPRIPVEVPIVPIDVTVNINDTVVSSSVDNTSTPTEPIGIPIVIPENGSAALCYSCMRPIQFCVCGE